MGTSDRTRERELKKMAIAKTFDKSNRKNTFVNSAEYCTVWRSQQFSSCQQTSYETKATYSFTENVEHFRGIIHRCLVMPHTKLACEIFERDQLQKCAERTHPVTPVQPPKLLLRMVFPSSRALLHTPPVLTGRIEYRSERFKKEANEIEQRDQ